jgi:cob(I)alamin adenosyltransferase
MSIVTKKGDKGITSLCYGVRVSKDDIRVHAFGTLDELCSSLGLSKSLIKCQSHKKLIESIQKDLFVICTELATEAESSSKLKKRIDKTYVSRLEGLVRNLEKNKPLSRNCFCLPGENQVSSTLHVSRAITRRAERLVVTLKRKGILLNDRILIYLNRLSDLLYLLARSYGKNQGGQGA